MDNTTNEDQKLLGGTSENMEAGDDLAEKDYLTSLKGIVAMITFVVCMATSMTSVQLLDRRIPDMELNTFRFTAPFIMCSIFLVVTKESPKLLKEEIFTMLVYSLLATASAMSIFVAVTFIPLTVFESTRITSAVIFGQLIFAIFWDEKINWKSLTSAVLCICGVLLVMQPWQLKVNNDTDCKNNCKISTDNTNFLNMLRLVNGSQQEKATHLTPDGEQDIFQGAVNGTIYTENLPMLIDTKEKDGPIREHFEDTSLTVNNTTLNPTNSMQKHEMPIRDKDVTKHSKFLTWIGYALAVICAVTQTLEVLLVKRNPFIAQKLPVVLFWILVLCLIVSTISMLMFETPVLPSNRFDVAMVVIHCLTAVLLWPLFIYAPKCISGNTVTAISSTLVIAMLIPQYTVLSSILPGHRNVMEVLGAISIFLGSGLSSIWEILRIKLG